MHRMQACCYSQAPAHPIDLTDKRHEYGTAEHDQDDVKRSGSTN